MGSEKQEHGYVSQLWSHSGFQSWFPTLFNFVFVVSPNCCLIHKESWEQVSKQDFPLRGRCTHRQTIKSCFLLCILSNTCKSWFSYWALGQLQQEWFKALPLPTTYSNPLDIGSVPGNIGCWGLYRTLVFQVLHEFFNHLGGLLLLAANSMRGIHLCNMDTFPQDQLVLLHVG